MREGRVHTALCEHGEEIVSHVDSRNSIETVLIQNRWQAHIAQCRILIAYAGGVYPIDAEAVCPKSRGFDRPVVFQIGVLCSGQVDHSIALISIAHDSGNGIFTVHSAVTPADLMFVGNL